MSNCTFRSDLDRAFRVSIDDNDLVWSVNYIKPGIEVYYNIDRKSGRKYFCYNINGIPATRQQAKNHLDLHRTKLAELL